MVAIPAVLVISSDAVTVVEHIRETNLASHIVVRLLAYCAERLVVNILCRCRGHLI